MSVVYAVLNFFRGNFKNTLTDFAEKFRYIGKVDRCRQFLGENLDAINVFSTKTPFAQKELETVYQCRDNLFCIMYNVSLWL